jgi:hypothetical protein
VLGAFSSRKKITLEETKETNSNLEFKKPFSDHAEAKSIAKDATCLIAQEIATNECGSGPGRHQPQLLSNIR